MNPATLLRVVVKAFASAALTFGLLSPATATQLLPGVHGYGLDRADNPAGFGEGSRVIHVTTVEDNGNDNSPIPGSLRAAIRETGPRVVVFDVSGVIEMKNRIVIRNGNLTIAGQTAPSPGIALHGQPVVVTTSNVLIQHLRVRPGDRWLPNPNTSNRDAIDVDPGNSTNVVRNVVIDHCTFAWSLDEIASTWNGWEDVTFNKCIFAEPLHRSIHLDESTLSGNVPKQIESLAVTPTNFGDPVSATHEWAVNGNYREWEAAADGATLEFVVPIVSATSASRNEHMVVGGITGPDRASFKVEVRLPDDTLLQESEVYDQYAPTQEAVSFVARTNTSGFTIPIGTTSLKVKLTVMGRNPASTGWKVGIDLFSFSQNHAMGPLFASGRLGAGRLTFNGSVIAHIQERGPWANSKHFVFANNVLYNRRNRFVMIGNNGSWTDPIHGYFVGNTFIDGRNMGTSPRNAIARQTPPAGTQLFEADNFYDAGDRPDAAPLFDPLLEPYRVPTDPTAPGHGMDGFVPLPVAEGYRHVLLTTGARPNDRDIMEARVMNEIAVGATIPTLAARPGTVKDSVAQAGGWPVYAENVATWTLPENPNGDEDNDGYTNIEEWLHELSAQLDGTPADGNNYQAEFAQLAAGSTIVTNAAGASGTGYVAGPSEATLTFNKVDGTTGGARLLRIRYALDGAAKRGEVVVNGVAQSLTFAPTGGTADWQLLDVPVTLASGNNVVVIRAGAAGLPQVDDFTVTGTDITPPVVTVPADITTDATGPDGAVVTFTVSAVDAIDGVVAATATPASGSVFAPGATTVQVTAMDNSGNTTTKEFTVTVVAHEPAIATGPATQTVTAGDTVTFSVAATGTPELAYDWQRDGVSLGAPSSPTLTLPAVSTSAAGVYSVVVTNAFGSATSAPATLTVNKAPVALTFGPLTFSYSGGAKPVTVTTVPDGLAVVITYNGSTTPPTLPGTYTVVATIDDPEFAGSVTTTITILPDVLVNHAPTLNGVIGGSIQVLQAENITLNGNAGVGGQLLVPGTPTVQLNGQPAFGGATDGTGSAGPATHRVTLNGNARLGGLMRRIDPIAMPVVSAPPAPTGTRNVTLNAPDQSAGDFASIRDLTLNGNAGTVAVPAGTYGRLTANGSGKFRLGVAGDTTPAIYNLQGLTLNGGSGLEIAGPVVITLASGTSFNASVGNPAHPEWLEVRVASGGVTLNGNVACHGSIIAPQGTVTINGSTHLAGHVVADRFTINGSGSLTNPADQSAPVVAITAPAAGATVSGTIDVAATASDDQGVAAVQFKLDGAPLGLEDTSAPFGVSWTTTQVTPGSHTLTAVARDFEGNTATASVEITVADQTPPTVAVTAPGAGARLDGMVTLSAAAADDVAVTAVQFQIDGMNFGPVLTAAPFTATWNTTAAAPGVHSVTAIARDEAGHETVSDAVPVVVADQAAPSIAITSPVDGATVGGVQAIAADTTDNVGIASVQFRLNGSDLGDPVTAAPFAMAWDTLPLAEGAYTLTAVARDAEGNHTESAPVTVNVRNVVFATFETGPVTGWTTDGGAWNVVEETGTHVWRQSDRAGVAYRALRDGTDWANQVVEADVKLHSANGSNRFFGVVARHQPAPNNYYYLILRTNNTIELKKLVNNVSANIATAVPFTVTANKSYRLTLEVIGTTLKGYVDGQLKIQGTDTAFASGLGGLLTYFTDVSFDDVHIDPTPLNPVLAADDFEGGAGAWTPEAGAWSLATAGTQVYRQGDALGLARATTGSDLWTSQIVEVDVTPRTFGQAGGWAGFLFRYVDGTHHYAVALRDGGKVELLRIDDGIATKLATANTPVTAGTKVWLRLNAVGNSFKVYRDGALVLQAVDDTYPAGKLALATAGAAADFDDVSVVAP